MDQVGDKGELRWTARLTELLLPVLRHQIEKHGVGATGAGNYYNIRIREDFIFRDHEIALASKFLACGLDIQRIDEIGSGFGQLEFLLGWNGFKTVGLEVDRQRAQTATILREILNLVDPELTCNIQLFNEAFPSPNTPQPGPASLVLTTNLIGTCSVDQQLVLLRAMRRYPFVVSDVLRFFDENRDPARSLELYEQAGLRNPELFLDAGSFGRFYLFVNTD